MNDELEGRWKRGWGPRTTVDDLRRHVVELGIKLF